MSNTSQRLAKVSFVAAILMCAWIGWLALKSSALPKNERPRPAMSLAFGAISLGLLGVSWTLNRKSEAPASATR